jgi:hypothetical protein
MSSSINPTAQFNQLQMHVEMRTNYLTGLLPPDDSPLTSAMLDPRNLQAIPTCTACITIYTRPLRINHLLVNYHYHRHATLCQTHILKYRWTFKPWTELMNQCRKLRNLIQTVEQVVTNSRIWPRVKWRTSHQTQPEMEPLYMKDLKTSLPSAWERCTCFNNFPSAEQHFKTKLLQRRAPRPTQVPQLQRICHSKFYLGSKS